MNNSALNIITNMLGQTIVDIKYIETKFHYDLSGDWTNVDTDLFVLHSPEWEINLSNGEKWFFTNLKTNLTDNLAKSNITVLNSTISKEIDNKHNVPNSFGWKNILGKKITEIKFYKKVSKRKNILGFEIGKTYQSNIQVIQFICSGNNFSITAMDGEIEHITFYPTSYFGDRLGFVFDKIIAESHTVNGLTTTMKITSELKLKR